MTLTIFRSEQWNAQLDECHLAIGRDPDRDQAIAALRDTVSHLLTVRDDWEAV